MSLASYDLRKNGGKRRRRKLPRKRKPRDRKVAGFILYGLTVALIWWLLPQAALTRWFLDVLG